MNQKFKTIKRQLAMTSRLWTEITEISEALKRNDFWTKNFDNS